MRTMRHVSLVALDAGKATVNGTKEARSRSSRRPNRKTGMGMTLLGAVSNTQETLEVTNGTLDKQKIEWNEDRKRDKKEGTYQVLHRGNCK